MVGKVNEQLIYLDINAFAVMHLMESKEQVLIVTWNVLAILQKYVADLIQIAFIRLNVNKFIYILWLMNLSFLR